MKRKFIPKSNDLIKLVDRKKDNNKEVIKIQQNINLNNNQIKNEEAKTIKVNNNNKVITNKNINYNINNNNIITILRIRPESEEEKNYSNINIIKVENSTSLKIISPTEYNYFIEGSKYLNNEKGIEVTQTKEYNYKFDYILDINSQQSEVYQYSTSFLVNNIFEGFNSTILAYGSTGSGKTYTMFGTGDKPGIIIRAINQILSIMENNGINKEYDLQISYFEIYNECIYDLLSTDDNNNNKKRKIAESSSTFNRDNDLIKFNNKKNNNIPNKFFLMGITKKVIKSEDEAFILLSEANKIRSKGITSQNVNSSRSHSIMHINIINKLANNNNNDLNKINLIENREKTKYGKFILVDLAGTEKVAEIKPNTDNFYINKSIFTLHNCINGLINSKNNNYIPWRDSKLTRILKEPLSGNSKIVMIANISPSLMVIEDTYNTLNFAKKIKLVKTYAQKNLGNQFIRIDKFDSAIQNLKNQISIVKNEIKQKEEENSLIYSEEQSDNKEVLNEEKEINEVLQEFIDKINAHFQKEIDVNKKINELELKISNINNENYFNQLNKNINKNDINKLNEYQVTINSLYSKRHMLVRQRRNIQLLINQETKKDMNNPENKSIGTYLMYVYKYNINLINDLQNKNRKYKIENDIVRKENQIQNLNNQIKLRDNVLKDIKLKLGNNNISYNKKKIIDLEELNLDPCVDINSIKENNNLQQFANKIISVSNSNTMKRNISMPFLRNQVKIFKKSNTKINKNSSSGNIINNSLPQIKTNKNIKTINNDSSLVQKRIPSGYLLRNHNSGLNNLKSNLGYKKYYNLYHISNNYHVGNLSMANPVYNSQINNGPSKFKKRNLSSSIDFENDYANKVKTILIKNYISRYKNSPYSLDNI